MIKAIQAPIHLRDTGPKVSNLHAALLFIVLHEPGISDNDRQSLQQRLAPEMRKKTFGPTTQEFVGILQNQFKNWPNYQPPLPQWLEAKVKNLPVSPVTGRGNGDVDTVTAEALNWFLKKLRVVARVNQAHQ
jgi:hypothetical protein